MRLDLNGLKRSLIVAEISANHGHSLKKAVNLIEKAKECGADAVKFQTYTPDTLTLDVDNRYFRIDHPEWGGRTLYQLYKEAYTPWKWFKYLKKAADDNGLLFFSTAFDRTSVDFLEGLGVPVHKISSFEMVDIPLIEYAARTGKPMILSTGMASLDEIKEAVSAARGSGTKKVALLKCVSSYPAKPEEMNLAAIPDMRKKFKCTVGISDHTMGTGVSVAAVTLGAMIVEKHFTSSRKAKSPDSHFSAEPAEFSELVSNIRTAEKAIGKIHYGLTPDQRIMRSFRRSLFAVRDIDAGETFSEDNIRSVRPAYGLKPSFIGKIIGKRSLKKISKGQPMKEEYFD